MERFIEPFCGLNSVAIAACFAASQGRRVVIVDLDYHYAGGTEDIVLRPSYPSSQLLIVDCYGASGDPVSITAASAAGHLCVALPSAVTDAQYLHALTPAMERVREAAPQIVFVSFGFDACVGDCGGGQITSSGFAELMQRVCKASGDAPVIVCLEGGYHLQCLKEAVRSTFRSLFSS